MQKSIDLQHFFANSRYSTTTRVINIEGPSCLDLEGWLKEPYLDEAGKTLNEDGKNPKGKHKETS